MVNRFKSRTEFTRNVVTLVTGTTIAQAIPVAISPILTRLYSPEDFGVFAIYFSMLMIVSVFATAKYEMAILLPKDNDEAKNILYLSLAVSISISVLLFLIVLFYFVFFEASENLSKARSSLLLLPLGVLLVGTSQALHYYLNRHGHFGNLAKGRIIRSISYSVSTLSLGALKPTGFALALSDSIGYLAHNFYLAVRNRIFSNIKTIKWASLKSVAKKYSNFPKYLIISGFLEKGSGQAPVLLLTNLFNSTISAGFFSFAQRMIVTPADLIARAISDVFRQKASAEFIANQNCRQVFLTTFKKLFIIGIAPFTLGYFIIVDVFRIVFGENWVIAGEYAQIMMPMFFLQFVISPLSIVFVIAEKQIYDLSLQIALFISVIGAFWTGYLYDDTMLSIQLFTIVYSLKYAVEFYLAFRFSLGSR